MSTNKPLIDIIDEMLNESIADDINKITADNQKKKEAAAISPDTQGVLGKESGAALDAGGDKDVGGSKGDNPSDASDNSSEVLGGKTGAALDGGGDKDVGKIDGKTAQPSGASAEVEADKGPHDQAKDPGLKEESDDELEEKLHGDQHKLDHNDNGKIDSGDMKDVRKKGATAHLNKEDWSFTDDETGEELTEEQIEELADYVLETYELDDETLEEMQFSSNAGKSQTRKQQMKKALTRVTNANDDGNKKISLAGPGGKKITATKTGSTEPGKRFKVKDGMSESFYVLDEETGEVVVASLEEMLDAGWTEEDLIEADEADEDDTLEEGAKPITFGPNSNVKKRGPNVAGPKDVGSKEKASMGDRASAAQAKERGANADAQKQRDQEALHKATGTKDSSGNVKTKSTTGDRDRYVPDAKLGKEIKKVHSADTPEEERARANRNRLRMIKAKVDAKNAQKEDFDLEEAQGEKLEKILGDANKAMRPDQEKDMEPKTKGDVFNGSEHKPHDQANDPIDTPTKANPKGAVSEESAIDEEFKAKAEVIFEAAVGEKVNIIKEEMKVQYDEMLQEEINDLNEKVAQFVEEAVEEWLTENALEVRYSLRTEVSENFIKGLKGLFNESYIEIPEEDYSVVDELTESVEEQKEQLDALTEELKEAKMFILEAKKKDIVKALSEDLTQTQAVRLEKLAEGLEAEDVAEFEEKVAQLKEGYFDPSSEQPLMSLTEEVFTGTEHIMEDDSGSVSQYAKFLSKTVLK